MSSSAVPLLRVALALLACASLSVRAATAFAQQQSHNLGDTPPACTTAQMIQNDGSFPSSYGSPGCLLPNNAGISINGTQAIYDGKGRFRLEVDAAGGSIMLHNQSYPVNYVVLWNYYGYRGGCINWGANDPLFECAPNLEYVNPNGSGGGGDQVGICPPGVCKLVFRPIQQGAHWFRLTALGTALGASGAAFHASASTIVRVPELPKVHASFTAKSLGGAKMQFDATSSTGNIERYQVFFGDNTGSAIGTSPIVEHEYKAAGKYMVTLSVYGESGHYDQVTKEIDVGSGLTLTMKAKAPQSQGVKSSDRVEYELAVDAPPAVESLVENLVVSAVIRADLVDVDPASITAGGVRAGDTITWTFDAGGLPAPFGFAATVKGQDVIPETILFISSTADAKATLTNGSELSASDGVALTYLRSAINVAITTVTRRAGRALPGEEVRYQIHVEVGEDTEKLRIDAAVPEGTKLVPGSITEGGVKKGKRIKWTFTGLEKPPVLEFKVAVPPEEKLKGRAQLDLDAKAEADLVRGDTVTGDATHVLPILLLIVEGTISDAVMLFPNSNVVNTGRPLAGAKVRLLREGGEVVSETVSDKKGKYRLGADDEGTFKLEVRKKGDQYSHFSNSITTEARDVVQRRQVSLQVPQPEPLVKDVILPVGVVNRAAQTLQKLNNFPVPLFSGAITTDLIQMYYDTAAAEAYVESVIAAAPEFPGVAAGGGPRDEWNAMIRAVAFWAVAATRVQDAIGLADDAGKTIALLVTVEVLKKLGQNKLISPTGSSVPELSRQRLKIGVMVTFVGTALPLILDGLGIQGQTKAQVIQIVASLLRFGADKWTGQFTDDLLFEIIFDVLRSAVVITSMGEIFGASSNATSLLPDGPILGRRGVQSLIDDVVAAAQVRRYAGDTLQALTAVNNQNDALKQSYTNVHFAATSALSVFGVFRGVKGLFEKGDKIEFTSGNSYTGKAKKAQALLGKLAKPVQVLSVIAAAEGIAHPLYEIAEVQLPGTVEMANTAFGVPVRSGSPPPHAPPKSTERTAFLEAARLLGDADRHEAAIRATGARAKPPVAGAVVTAYLDVMKRLEKALKTKDPLAVAPLRVEQAAADAAVFTDYLDPLTYQVQAALPAIGDPGVGAELLAFLDDVVLASTRCGIYYMQLDLWELAPLEAAPSAVAKDAKLCSAALIAADAAAARAAAATGGIVTAGRLVITGGDLPPTVLHAGQTFQITFTVTNVGDGGLPAGSATLKTPGEHLHVGGSAAQTLPALPAGAAATLTWSLTAEASPAAYLAAYQLEVGTDGADPTLFTDFTLVQP